MEPPAPQPHGGSSPSPGKTAGTTSRFHEMREYWWGDDSSLWFRLSTLIPGISVGVAVSLLTDSEVLGIVATFTAVLALQVGVLLVRRPGSPSPNAFGSAILPVRLPDELEREVLDLLRRDEFYAAVRLTRSRTDVGLAVANRAVIALRDSLSDDHAGGAANQTAAHSRRSASEGNR